MARQLPKAAAVKRRYARALGFQTNEAELVTRKDTGEQVPVEVDQQETQVFDTEDGGRHDILMRLLTHVDYGSLAEQEILLYGGKSWRVESVDRELHHGVHVGDVVVCQRIFGAGI